VRHTNGVPGALYIMITAVVISVLIMMQIKPVCTVPQPSFLQKVLIYQMRLILKPCNACAKRVFVSSLSPINMKAAKRK
jgi:hypothetical protein